MLFSLLAGVAKSEYGTRGHKASEETGHWGCIRPEVVGISSHFGSLVKGMPVARGKGANFNKLLLFGSEQIDWISGGVDVCVRVKISKVP